MNKISIKDQQRLERLNDELREKLGKILPLLTPAREALKRAEEKRAEIYSVIEDIVREMQETEDSRSEKWRGSAKGEAYSNWIMEIGDLLMSVEAEITLDLPEEVDELTPQWMTDITAGNYSVEPAE